MAKKLAKAPQPFQDGTRIGIIGGGQLGRMLIRHGLDLNIYPLVLDADHACPSKNVAYDFTTGAIDDFETVARFARDCDIVTIEIEHVNADALEAAEKEGVKVYPQPHVIRIIQDKGLQKQLFQKHKIPTADFILLDDREQVKHNINFLPAVQKMRRFGYDGRGVIKLKTKSDVKNAFDVPSVLEKLVPIKKEVAILMARNKAGQIAIYPAVEQVFNPKKNILEYLLSPARLTPELEKKAVAIVRQIANATGIIGLLAVEMFITEDDEVLVNELAPRPHNSGHQTMEGNETSQFEQLLRALMNLPLGSTKVTKPSVMINLLGEPGFTGRPVYYGLEKVLAESGAHVHLYGKFETRPFRKMGHITVTANTLEEAEAKARKAAKMVKVKT